jgi:hypothetical protein
MKIVLGQPGGYGDLFFCAPIAKHYSDEGHEVFWPVGDEHLSIIEQFPYVTAMSLPDERLVEHSDPREVQMISKVLMGMQLAQDMGAQYLNLADRPVPTSMPEDTGETPEEKKYRVSNVSWEKKYTLEWRRDLEKENKLFDLVTDSKDYIFCHLDQSDGTKGLLPERAKDKNIVECRVIEGYNILDWYKVIVNASEIYCIESSVGAFVDGLGDKVSSEKFLLSTKGNKFVTKSRGWIRCI